MKNSSPLSNLPFLRRHGIGLAEVEALLDSLPLAVLLVNTNNYQIVVANGKAAELTAFTRSELNDADLTVLFPNLGEKEFFRKLIGRVRYWDLEMIKRNGLKTEVQVTPSLLDSQGKWMLLGLEPVAHRQQKQVENLRDSQLWDSLPVLANAPHESDLEVAFQTALQVGQTLTGASLLVVYQGSQDDPIAECRSAWGEASLLPKQITNQDYHSLKKPYIWTPGSRSLSSLHRAARAAKLTYLASAPLGLPNAMIGLIVIASDQTVPTDNTLPFLKVLAATITTIIQQHILLETIDQYQDDLQKALGSSSAIKEGMQDGVVIIAPDQTIQEMNFSAEQALGYSLREVYGQHHQNIFIGVDNLFPTSVNSVADISTFNSRNVRLFRRNGQAFLANLRAVPMIVDDRVECVIVLIEDLSLEEDFRVRTQQLEQRAMLGEVMAVFAHEVRNPINNISVGLQFMAMKMAPENPDLQVVERLQQDCERLAELMKSILQYAKPVELNLEPVDLSLLLKRMLERWNARLAMAKIESMLQVDDGTPCVEGDQRALEQVFTNLISNAIQAMNEKGGILTLKVRKVAQPNEVDMVEVSVSDTGIGIPDEIRDHIFEPFFTTHEKGTGLGLAITNRIINNLKGKITVISIPGGTVFQIQLPIANHQSIQETDSILG